MKDGYSLEMSISCACSCVGPAATFPLRSTRHVHLSAQRECAVQPRGVFECAYGGDWAGGCVRRVIACCSEAMAVT